MACKDIEYILDKYKLLFFTQHAQLWAFIICKMMQK